MCGTSSPKSGLAAVPLFMGKHVLPSTVSRAFQRYSSTGSRSVFMIPPSSIADTLPRETRGAAKALTVVRYNLGPFLALGTAGPDINDASWGWLWMLNVSGRVGVMISV